MVSRREEGEAVGRREEEEAAVAVCTGEGKESITGFFRVKWEEFRREGKTWFQLFFRKRTRRCF